MQGVFCMFALGLVLQQVQNGIRFTNKPTSQLVTFQSARPDVRTVFSNRERHGFILRHFIFCFHDSPSLG